jgi:hypothetical protein
MIGCYDFCAHYEWTFAWLEREGGPAFLRDYWEQAISHDSQRHARALIAEGGFAGMAKYWGHTLAEESPDLLFAVTERPDVFRIDMYACPSKGFLLTNGLQQHRDYCDHCLGWIGPVMRDAGYVIDHEHNHCGQCWWEMRRAETAPTAPPPAGAPRSRDVRTHAGWNEPGTIIDRYIGALSPDQKQP